MSKFPVKGGDFTPVPEGVHLAVCKHEGLCLVTSPQFSKHPDGKLLKQRYIFQIEENVPGKDFRFEVRATFGPVMGKKSKQRAFIESWLGRSLDDKAASEFDSKFMLNRACQINVIHVESGGKMYANISTIMPLPKGIPTPPFTVEYYSKDGERDLDRWDREHREAEEWDAANRNAVDDGTQPDEPLPF